MTKNYWLQEAKKRGFVDGARFTSIAGIKNCVVSHLVWTKDILHDVNNGLVFDKKTGEWAKLD